MDIRLECPHCKTSYNSAYCGLAPLDANHYVKVTVACMICKLPFDADITPRVVSEKLSWWSRMVLRREPKRTTDGHEVVTTKREHGNGTDNVGTGGNPVLDAARGPGSSRNPVD